MVAILSRSRCVKVKVFDMASTAHAQDRPWLSEGSTFKYNNPLISEPVHLHWRETSPTISNDVVSSKKAIKSY